LQRLRENPTALGLPELLRSPHDNCRICAVCKQKRSPINRFPGIGPIGALHDMSHGSKCGANSHRDFGCTMHVRHRQTVIQQFEPTTFARIIVGYVTIGRGYRIYNPKTWTFVDLAFNETVFRGSSASPEISPHQHRSPVTRDPPSGTHSSTTWSSCGRGQQSARLLS